jgi:hypothetical protein
MIQEADENCEKDATVVEGGTFLNKVTLNKGNANYDLPVVGSSKQDEFEFEVGGESAAYYRAQEAMPIPHLSDSPGSHILTTSFEMRNPIDLSIDPTRQTQNELPTPSPTNAGFSRITGIHRGNGGTAPDFS